MEDIPFDSIWCPGCSRQIVPKRTHIPIQPQPPTRPATPATDVRAQPDALPRARARGQRGKSGTARPRAPGLVNGTGRVKPNGAIKRSPINDAPALAPTEASAPPPKPTGIIRHRTVIDQTPASLYCSDECRLADLQSPYLQSPYNITGIKPDWRGFPQLPSAPHISVSDVGDQESDPSSESSVESRTSAPAPSATVASQPPSTPENEAYARLAKIYDLPPLPPAPPLLPTTATPAAPQSNFDGGVIMAARRIQAALFPDKLVKSSWGIPCFQRAEPDKPIPGWTDGSNAWRASVYGFAPPRDFTLPGEDEAAKKAYGSYVASPHRSRGVNSTLGERPSTIDLPIPITRSVVARVMDASTQELYAEYFAAFARRAESRNIGRRHSPKGTDSVREEPILKPGAEGRLLVPDVKLKRVSLTMSHADSTSNWSLGNGRQQRNPLSRQNCDDSVVTTETRVTEEDAIPEAYSLPATRRRVRQTHIWSYSEDTLTYPIPCDPPKIEKRIVRQVVDGVEQDVEIEVEVHEPLKRLFLFPSAVDRAAQSMSVPHIRIPARPHPHSNHHARYTTPFPP